MVKEEEGGDEEASADSGKGKKKTLKPNAGSRPNVNLLEMTLVVLALLVEK